VKQVVPTSQNNKPLVIKIEQHIEPIHITVDVSNRDTVGDIASKIQQAVNRGIVKGVETSYSGV